MTARIPAAQAPFSEQIQATLSKMTPAGQNPLALFTTLARDERLFSRFMAGSLLDRGNLTIRQREIVIDRTTALCKAEYEWGVHVKVFKAKAELTDEQIESTVKGGADDACWTASEALLIRLCDELHHTATVSDALWKQLHAEFKEEALIELLMVAGLYRTVSYLVNGLRLPLEPTAARFAGR